MKNYHWEKLHIPFYIVDSTRVTRQFTGGLSMSINSCCLSPRLMTTILSILGIRCIIYICWIYSILSESDFLSCSVDGNLPPEVCGRVDWDFSDFTDTTASRCRVSAVLRDVEEGVGGCMGFIRLCFWGAAGLFDIFIYEDPRGRCIIC